MIDPGEVRQLLGEQGLERWADVVDRQLEQVLQRAPHGDWTRWQGALRELPVFTSGSVGVEDGALSVRPSPALSDSERAALVEALRQLHPWRKGPYRIDAIHIDTEWRSDWKWERVCAHLAPLAGRRVLDVGCGNGYYAWRMVDAGAASVIGIDPTAVFFAQYLAIRQLLAPLAPAIANRFLMLPLGIESVPPQLARFDTVFSMGVLYHRRSPIDHLIELRDALRPGGELVLETLVVEGDAERVLVPKGRYAKMRNVWFIPSTTMLETWLARCGYRQVRTVDVTPTGLGEQRSTAWMTFESLADFLDPADRTLTVEGYPAPRRAVLIATK